MNWWCRKCSDWTVVYEYHGLVECLLCESRLDNDPELWPCPECDAHVTAHWNPLSGTTTCDHCSLLLDKCDKSSPQIDESYQETVAVDCLPCVPVTQTWRNSRWERFATAPQSSPSTRTKHQNDDVWNRDIHNGTIWNVGLGQVPDVNQKSVEMFVKALNGYAAKNKPDLTFSNEIWRHALPAAPQAAPPAPAATGRVCGSDGEDRQRTWDRRFLQLAEQVASWSKDPSTKVGAVIVDAERRVVSTGYNGFARRVDDSTRRYGDRDLKIATILHAEENAILFARRDLAGHTLYTWPFQPCAKCAGAVIQSGITRVVAPPLPESLKERWAENTERARRDFEDAGVLLEAITL